MWLHVIFVNITGSTITDLRMDTWTQLQQQLIVDFLRAAEDADAHREHVAGVRKMCYLRGLTSKPVRR